MKKRYICAVLLLACGWAPTVHAEEPTISSGGVVIAVVQTGQEGAAGNDFTVLYNTGDQEVDVTGWRVQYRAASATGSSGWTTKRTIACLEPALGCTVILPAGGTLIAATFALDGVAVQPMPSGFSDIGGQLRLTKPLGGVQTATVDTVGYGTAAESEGAPAVAPPAGKVLIRSMVNTRLADTNNNGADFIVGCFDPLLPGAPKAVSCDPAVDVSEEEEEPVPPLPLQPADPPAGEPQAYAKLTITELLPDPESPATDTADEFVEIHNPGSEPVNLEGYTLQAGTDFKDTYTFGTLFVPAGGYVAVMSSMSHVGLTNSGTAVQLLNPAGEPTDTVASYGQAKSGKGWAKHPAGDWRWTTPSPSAPNVFTADASPAVLSAVAAVKKAATAKKAATTAKPKATKAASAAGTKAAAKTPPASTAAPTAQENSPVPYLILGVVGLGVVSYAAYEYRQDIARMARRIRVALFGRKQQAEPTLQTD